MTTARHTTKDVIPTHISGLRAVIQNLPVELRRIVGEVHGTQYEMEECIQAAQDGRLVGVSDGSVLDGQGNHGWIACGGDIDTRVRGKDPVDGPKGSTTSYRAEL